MLLNKWTFIIPAAGKSKRFSYHKKKIFYKINNFSIIEIIVNKVNPLSKKIVIITSKTDLKALKKIFKNNKKIKFVIQNKINGMATAILKGLAVSFTRYTAILWADQIGITKATMAKTIKKHTVMKNLISMPIVKVKQPYTLIKFKKKNLIKKIIQSREEPINEKIGFKDCGFFCVNTFKMQKILKKLVTQKKILTKKTNEYDFLMGFQFISIKEKIYAIKSKNAKDGLGINSISDLKNFK